MCIGNDWKKIAAFSLAFVFGCFSSSALNFKKLDFENNFQSTVQLHAVKLNSVATEAETSGGGMGSARCYGPSKTRKAENIKDLKITSKPRAVYTDAARLNKTQGNVLLRVTFLSSGEIGEIVPVKELPDGLTESAVAAAKLIKFKPQKVNGQPKSVIKTVQFSFVNFEF